MGRLFLIEYDQTPDEKLYLCRLCHTHIALKKYLVLQTFATGTFDKAVNVLTDDPIHYRRVLHRNITVADVICTKCNRLLGRKYVQLDAGARSIVIREGRIRMNLNELLFWNGHHLEDPMTKAPVNI